MNNKADYLIKNIGILTISNFASKILVFLLVPLYTNILSDEQVGIYDLVGTTISLIAPILTLNIADAVMRFMMDRKEDPKKIVSTGARIVILSAVPAGLSLFIISAFGFFPQIKELEIYIFLFYFLSVLNSLLVQVAKGLEKVKAMAVSGIISTVITLLLNILFLAVFKFGLKGFFAANIISTTVSAGYLFFATEIYKYIISSGSDKKLRHDMLLYSTPLIASAIGWWVNSASDRYVVSFWCGVAATGILSVAYKIPQIINVLQGIIMQAWQISAFKEYGNKGAEKFYGNTFSVVNLIMSAACSFLTIMTVPLGALLYKKGFFAACEFVPFLLLSCVINSASGILGPILSTKKDSRSMAIAAVCGAVTNIALNFLLIYLTGIQGACIATVVSSLVIYFIRKRAVGKEIEIEDYPKVLITWALLCVQAVIEIYTPFWWAQIIIMGLLLWLNRRGLTHIRDFAYSVLMSKGHKL